MSEVGKAVFLSYASQDAEAARKICESLRQGGVEVWFDADGGLEHGDEWDAKIRRQIKECVLFIPLISASTQARHEGYFRIEWELAAQRAMGIASGVPFILPVVIDDTREPDALVPDRFRAVQWTRLRNGEVAPEVRARFLKLWSHRTSVLRHEAQDVARAFLPVGSEHGQDARATPKVGRPLRGRLGWIAAAVTTVVVVGILGWRQLSDGLAARRRGAPLTAAAPASTEADQLVARAYSLFEKMNYTRANLAAAEDLTRKATEVASDSARAWAARAYVQSCFILRGWDTSEIRRQDTQDLANRALALDPNATEAMLALAYVLSQQNAHAQAEVVLRRALALRTDDPRLRLALSGAIGRQGRIEEAMGIAQETVRLFPRDPLAHYSVAGSLVARADFAAALEKYDAALAVQSFAGALLAKATLLAAWRGDLAAARATLSQIPPEDRTEDRAVGIAMWLGLLEHNPARVHEAAALTARNYLDDSNTIARGAKAAAVALAFHLDRKESLARQQWQTAESVLRQRLRENPESAGDQTQLATVLGWLGRTEDAAREIAPFEATAREQPSVVNAVPLAKFYASVGDATKALPYLRRALNKQTTITDKTLPLDPWWDKLRGQPEFEALLAEAKQNSEARGQTPEVRGQKSDGSGPGSARSMDLATAKSVAVLAFANLSDDKENEYFSDGIAEELLNVLAKVPGLKVSGRTSSFYFKGRQVPMAEIAQQLGVAYIVRGSVRKAGNRVRITAQLSRASTDEVVWSSETLDRELKDVFAVQEEIAGLIARNLQLKLGDAPRAAKLVDPEAFRLFLAGRAQAEKSNNAAMQAAVDFFQQAVALEPNYGEAWGQLARAHIQLARWGGVPVEVGYAAARLAIAQAVALEPGSPDVLVSLGWVRRTADWDWRGAEQAFRRALEMRPNHSDTLADTAVLLYGIGRSDEALQLARRAVSLDPLNPATQLGLSQLFRHFGDFVKGEQACRRALQLAPEGQRYHAFLSRPLSDQRRFDEAEREAALEKDELGRLYALALVEAGRGKRAEALAYVHSIEAMAQTHPGMTDIFPYAANIYARLGDFDHAFAALELQRAARDTSIPWTKNAFDLRPLHRDPRWPVFLRKIGLADDQLN